MLVLQLPLRGVLKSGGLVFVLKGEASKKDRCGLIGIATTRGHVHGRLCMWKSVAWG